MEFLFNSSLQIFALFFTWISLLGVTISFVIFLVEYFFATGSKLKVLYREVQENKKNSQEWKEAIAHILLPDESHATTTNDLTIEQTQVDIIPEDIQNEGDIKHELVHTVDEIIVTEVTSEGSNDAKEDIDLEIGWYASINEQDNEGEFVWANDSTEDESEETQEEWTLAEEDLYERIKKPIKTSLQGDIFVSNQPHTTLDTPKEGSQKDSLIVDDTPSDEILNEIQLHISRGDYTRAHPLIIEWLSFDRHHKTLNIALAEVYESESDYHRAEILYADIIRKHGKDADLLARLALMLSFAGKYQTSYELYQEAYILDNTSDEVISMLLNLAALLGDYRASKEFADIYLKKYPRHIDTLEVQAKNALELRDGTLFDKIITTLRGLAWFDARTHARVADLMQERSDIGELYYNDKFPE